MKRLLLLLITVMLLALVSCGGDTGASATEGDGPATSAVEDITTGDIVAEGVTEDEIPDRSEAPSEDGTTGDTPNEESAPPSGEVDLPKVEF